MTTSKGQSRHRSIIPAEQLDSPQRRRAILRAAAELFAEMGYEGVSLRNIAERANVPVGLCTYYFGKKTELYSTLFEHDRHRIDARIKGLKAIAKNPAAYSLQTLVATWIKPVLESMNAAEDRPFGTLAARAIWDSSEVSKKAVEAFYDPVAFAFLRALGLLLPDRDPIDLVWAYEWAVGALLMHLADHRIERLSKGKCSPGDVSKGDLLVAFVTAGFTAIPLLNSQRTRT